jgi:hypothetical protein
MKILRQIFLIIFLVLLSLPPLLEDAMAIEKVKYRVLEKERNFELRQYEPHIVAETIVEGDFDAVGNEGFRRLFRYISGDNRKKQTISMTTPVSQEARSEKISMTAPVNLKQAGNKWSVTFTMPAKYTRDTLPEPDDDRILLREIPAQRVAAMKYSGTWSKSRYEKHKALLVQMVNRKNLKPAGDYIFARYNPPFMPWFLRRNEVLLPIKLPLYDPEG